MEAIQWSDQPVSSGIELHFSRQQQYAQNCENVIEILGDAAADLSRGDGAEPQIEQLRQAVAQVLEARRAAQNFSAALQELKGSYRAGPGATDFRADLSQRAEAAAAAAPYNPRTDPLFREFELSAGGEDGAGGAEDEQIDDDIAIEGGAAQLAPNTRCPITNKLLLDIEEPVQDATGVVYEHAAVIDYFRMLHPSNHGKSRIVAGSSHYVTLAEIVPAEKVIREKRRAARRQKQAGRSGGGGHGGGEGEEDVLDI